MTSETAAFWYTFNRSHAIWNRLTYQIQLKNINYCIKDYATQSKDHDTEQDSYGIFHIFRKYE